MVERCTFRSVNALEIDWPSASRLASTTTETPLALLLCSSLVVSPMDSVAEVVDTVNSIPPSFPLFSSVFLRLFGKKMEHQVALSIGAPN